MLQNNCFKQQYIKFNATISWSIQNLPEHPLVQNFFAGYICKNVNKRKILNTSGQLIQPIISIYILCKINLAIVLYG